MDNLGYVPDENGRVFSISRYPSTNQHNPNDYLVEINSRSKIFKKPEFFKRLSLLLCIVAVVFLIALIVLIILYCKRKPQVCLTDECLRAATNFKYSIDFSVDPCDNFYDFTCGKWSEEHPNHGWYPSFSTFSTIDEKMSIYLMNFFKSTPKEDEPEAVTKARNFYESCMDDDSINNLGLSVVYKYLNISGLPLVPSLFTLPSDQHSSLKVNWLKIEANLKKTLAMDVFFGFSVSANLYNISQNVIYFGTPEAKCPLPSPVKSSKKSSHRRYKDIFDVTSADDENDEEDNDSSEEYDLLVQVTRAKLVKYIIKGIMKNNSLEEPNEEALDVAADLINNITIFIKDMSKNYSAGINNYNVYNKTIAESETFLHNGLLNYTKNKYPDFFINYLNYLFEGSDIVIDTKTDHLYFYDNEEKYMPIMLSHILNLSQVHLELYMWWVTVYAMIMSTSSNIVTFIATQVAPFYGDNEIIRTRAFECTSLTSSYMSMAASYILADKAFKNNTKPKVERMINEIKSVFVQEVNSIKWMDKATKKATLDKCHETLSFIGYPDWLFKNGSINEIYKKVEIDTDNFLENMIGLIKSDVPESLNSLRESNHRNWSTDPNTVNAYNSFFDNAINVPMGILKFPMYNLGLEVLNYGSIGSILGHELTHGFDNSGRKHDKYGNFIQWWSNNTIETFENMTQCFVEQYDNFTLDGIDKHVDGKQTLGENIADNGGLNQAFKAYARYVEEYGEEARLPGFEQYNNYQLFFIAYGSIWCETATKFDLENQIEYDEHAPNSVRVIGTLQNSHEFAKMFNCPSGSNMNPDRKKCKIW